MKADNFRLVAAGGLPEVIKQVRRWHEGVRITRAPALGIAPPVERKVTEDEAWDALIRNAPDDTHFDKSRPVFRGRHMRCQCSRCRAYRKYK